MLERPLLHVAITVLFRGRARDLAIFSNERLFEFFNLLIVFHDLALDLWDDVLPRLWYVLLGRVVQIVVKWVRLFTFKRRSRNLWSALHLGGQVSRLELRKLIL